LDSRFSAHGVRGLVLMPTYVATPFSDEVRGEAPALLPQEVAAAVADMIDTPEAPAVALEVGRRVGGAFGFSSTKTVATTSPVAAATAPSTSSSQDATSLSVAISNILRRVFRLSDDFDLSNGRIGLTPGWDSLRQIEVILALESGIGIQFTSTELAELGSFDAILAACKGKVSELS
jgi:acyl carrier protein